MLIAISLGYGADQNLPARILALHARPSLDVPKAKGDALSPVGKRRLPKPRLKSLRLEHTASNAITGLA